MTTFAADRSRRTTETDRWLAGLLGAEPGVALVAVGGYGRKELLPGSDLDVLLLHDGREGIAKIADRIWYPVWDSGARLDHAVRTVPQARRVARNDLKVALGLLNARHVAGDPDLTTRLREGALEDWRGNARTRLAELKELHEERTRMHGELAFLLEPDLKESRGGQRDVHAIQAIAAAWVAPAPGPRVRAAYEQILDARHVLHEVTGRHMDRLVLEEQDEVARTLGLLDGDALLRQLAGAGRTVAYAVDHAFRQADRAGGRRAARRADAPRQAGAPPARGRGGRAGRRGGAGAGRGAGQRSGARAARRRRGGPDGPAAGAARARRLADCPPLPVPWPDDARDALVALLGAGQAAIAVWEALDQEGLLTALIPDWERVRNRPQRNPLHRFTVDRHLVECAANAAALTRDVSRPDLLLLAALLHDIGKGWPGDHSVSGEVVARDVCQRVGLSEADSEAGRRRGPPPPAAPRGGHPQGPRRPDDRPARRDRRSAAGCCSTCCTRCRSPTGWRPAPRPGTTGRPAWSRTWYGGSPRCWTASPCPSPRRCARTSSRSSPRAARRRSSRAARSPWWRWTGPACCGTPRACWPRTGSRCAAPTRPRSATSPSRCSAWRRSTATRRTPTWSPPTCGACSRAGWTWRTGSSAGRARPGRAAAPRRRPR